MKNFKNVLVVLVVILGLTGCSFGKDKDKEDKKETKPKKIDVISEPLELDSSLFGWTGSFENKEYNYTMNIYVSANGNSLTIDLNTPGEDDSYVDEDGKIHISINGGQSVSFTAEDIDGDQINVDNEYLGLKGNIKKSENGYTVDLVMGDAHEMYSFSGEYTEIPTESAFKGYYVDGDYKAFAITPLADTIMVSYVTVEEGLYNSSDLMCDYEDEKITCDSENIEITLTDEGKIKVASDDDKIAGEYAIYLKAFEKE